MSTEDEIKEVEAAIEAIEVEVDEPEVVIEEVPAVPDRSTKSHSDEEEVVEEKEVSEEEEAAEYSKKVQKRIDQLTARARQAERAKEEAELRAEKLATEQQQTNQRLASVDNGYLREFGTRVEAQLDQARVAYRQAMTSGSADDALAAQEKLNSAMMEQAQHSRAVRMAESRANNQQAPAQQASAQTQPNQTNPPQQQADPRAEQWARAEGNEWFGEDKVMTFATYGLHQELVDNGVDPRSEEYYDELDKRLRAEFPHKFNEPSQPQGVQQRASVQTVAGAGRSATAGQKTGRGKKTIRLNQTQVNIAEELGVPLEEYAKYITGEK